MSNVRLPYSIVDAFTGKAFTGNPAAVVMIDEFRPDWWFKRVAAEFNLAETAFIETLDNGDFRIRWFTPTTEVDLCGHATIAAAYALWVGERAMKEEPIIFHSRSGRFEANLDGSWIELDFPRDEPEPADPPLDPESIIGVPVKATAKAKHDWLFEVESEDVIRELEPDFDKITELGGGDPSAPAGRGLIVTGPPSQMEGVDFVSRCFYPAAGIKEDPVTGSAHCTMACYWGPKLDKTSMRGFQASWRGGIVKVDLVPNAVNLAGQAVMVMQGRVLK